MNKFKVLIIDDDISICYILTTSLQDEGYEVHCQNSLKGVIQIIKEFNPNLIVLDVQIGDRSSINSLPEIMEISENIPIIFISSHTETNLIKSAIRGGGSYYLKKPFDTEELLIYIEKLCTANLRNRELYFGLSKLCLSSRYIISEECNISHRLGKTEYEILKLLALNLNQIVTREDIIEKIFIGVNASEHSLNNMISRLRRYLSNDKSVSIVTLREQGYSLRSND